MPRPWRLHPFRRRFRELFDRLEREHGVRAHLAHNMTVTPANVAEVAEVVRVCRQLGYRMCSFQPAAFVGDQRRWKGDYRTLSGDDVWAQIELGAGARLPYRALQVGDLRCNRVTFGLWAGRRYVPLLDDRDPRDLRARDLFLRALPGNLLFAPLPIATLRIARAAAAHGLESATALTWALRFARRVGSASLTGRLHPTTYVMHRFMDARDVAVAWRLLEQGAVSDDPRLREVQERLEACAYGMAHPELGRVVPACVQHSVFDETENDRLASLLPIARVTGGRTRASAPAKDGPRPPDAGEHGAGAE